MAPRQMTPLERRLVERVPGIRRDVGSEDEGPRKGASVAIAAHEPRSQDRGFCCAELPRRFFVRLARCRAVVCAWLVAETMVSCKDICSLLMTNSGATLITK